MKKSIFVILLLLLGIAIISCSNESFEDDNSSSSTVQAGVNNDGTKDEEPPAQQYTTYYLDNYEELIKSFSKDNSESEIQKDKANHSPEFAAFVDKLVEEESLVLPYISDELLPLRNLEGFPNLIVWESEAFERPWIWFFGEYEGKRFRVMLTSVDDVENAQSLDGMEILGN